LNVTALASAAPIVGPRGKEGSDVRHKHAVHAAVAAIIAFAVLVFGSASAVADGKGKRNTLRLVATEIQSEFIDLGDPGPSLGDEFVFSEVLRKRGREVGTSGGVCVVTEAVPPYTTLTFHCVATLSLERGQITLQGLVEVQGEDDPGPFTVAITGGTGAFRGASGEAKVFDVSDTVTIYKLSFDKHKKKKPRHKHH
jgi:hypothetical protein